jgi:RNA polymerase sigma-70 factor (ECF subfamily)
MNAYTPTRNNIVSLPTSEQERDAWQTKLLAVAKTQDRKAFSELFAHFGPKIKAFAMANPYTSNPAQFGDELVQEVMIKVWNKANNYNPAFAGASTWIFTIARNCRIDLIRKNQRHSYPLESDELLEFEAGDDIQPFQLVQQKHYERDIRECLNQLPSDQAQIIVKVYMEGKSHNEIAEELNLPLGTVKSRVRLALTKLKVMVAH